MKTKQSESDRQIEAVEKDNSWDALPDEKKEFYEAFRKVYGEITRGCIPCFEVETEDPRTRMWLYYGGL